MLVSWATSRWQVRCNCRRRVRPPSGSASSAPSGPGVAAWRSQGELGDKRVRRTGRGQATHWGLLGYQHSSSTPPRITEDAQRSTSAGRRAALKECMRTALRRLRCMSLLDPAPILSCAPAPRLSHADDSLAVPQAPPRSRRLQAAALAHAITTATASAARRGGPSRPSIAVRLLASVACRVLTALDGDRV